MLSWDPEAKCFLQNNKPIEFSASELEEMHSLIWWQGISFSPTVKSRGNFQAGDQLKKHALDVADFKGKSVLGIGCYEGFQLYYAEACGASKVVGLTYDFNHRPLLSPARNFAHRKLGSKVEWVDTDIYELNSDELGTFDIVMFFDGLLHLMHPMLALQNTVSVCHGEFIYASPFVVSPNDIPWCALTPSNEPKPLVRNCSGPNLSWLIMAIRYQGIKLEHHNIWDVDYLVVRGKREFKQSFNPPSLEALPTDHGLESKTAVLMITCKKYQQVWEPFFHLFKRFWSDCPYRLYFGSDFGTYPGVESIELKKDLGWQGNCIEILKQIPAEWIILFQEDFLLNGKVSTEKIRRLVRHAIDFDVGCLRLSIAPGPSGAWAMTDALGTIGFHDDFRFSLQASIWKKEVLLKLLIQGEDFWALEFTASRRSLFINEPFLCISPLQPAPLPYIITAVIRGKWQDEALELMKREGVPMDNITKEIK